MNSDVLRTSGVDASRIRAVETSRPIIGRLPLAMMGGLMLTSLAVAAYGSWAGLATPRMSAAPLIESRDLLFKPVGVSGFEVREASGAIVASIDERKGDGFVVSVVRSLAYQRRTAGLPPTERFRLTLHQDGRSYLIDQERGQFIATGSFGGGNAAHVKKLLGKGG